MRRTFPSCSGSAPISIHARPSATKATPARPTAKPHAIAASFPSSRPRRTRRTGPPSSPERSTGGVPASSRPSASSNASSASPYAARRQSETLLPSSRSSQASSWPNPSTRPNNRRLFSSEADVSSNLYYPIIDDIAGDEIYTISNTVDSKLEGRHRERLKLFTSMIYQV